MNHTFGWHFNFPLATPQEIFDYYVKTLKYGGEFYLEKEARIFFQQKGFSLQTIDSACSTGRKILDYHITLRAGHLSCKNDALKFATEKGLHPNLFEDDIFRGENVILGYIRSGGVLREPFARKFVRKCRESELEYALEEGHKIADIVDKFKTFICKINYGSLSYEEEARRYIKNNEIILANQLYYKNNQSTPYTHLELLEEALQEGKKQKGLQKTKEEHMEEARNLITFIL